MKIQITADLLDGLVLAILEHDDFYGYALTQQMQEVIAISESTLYPVLRRLKKEGYLMTYDQPYQGRNRRYYQITAAGRIRLSEVKKLWNDYKDSLDKVFNSTVEGEKND